MNIDIRNHIINNFKNNNKEEFRNSIVDSINEHDEVTLPGMGVFMELIWNNSTEAMKDEILNILEESVKEENTI